MFLFYAEKNSFVGYSVYRIWCIGLVCLISAVPQTPENFLRDI